MNDKSTVAVDVAMQIGKPSLFRDASFRWCLLSLVLYWVSFPPVNWWVIAWIAPIGWVRLIREPESAGRRPLVWLYLVGWVHWLSMTYWVTLPHPLAAVGWFFLAAYLALFWVGFVLLARRLVHQNRFPAVVGIPVAWVSMEVLRTYLFTGFGLVPLSHSQVDFLPVIQIASVTGAYGVSFVVMMFAASFEGAIHRWRSIQPTNSRIAFWSQTGVSLVCIFACWLFGTLRLSETVEPTGTAQVAIVQGVLDTEFAKSTADVERILKQRDVAFADYSRMTSEVAAGGDLDLIVWPESMFSKYDGIIKYDPSLADFAMDSKGMSLKTFVDVRDVATKQHIQWFGTKCLMGSSTTEYGIENIRTFNTAALYSGDGELLDAYDKVHPVMFGEYIPFGSVFPWIYRLSPLGGGLTPGDGPRLFPAGGVGFSPCICFENTVPHLIRKQLGALEGQGRSATALVTLTNDGWFWGSALLDVHLACGIFRAVENRRPMVIAANTGISAHIDDVGRVLQASPKRTSRVLIAEVKGVSEFSFYTKFGDVFGYACVLVSGIGLLLARLFPVASAAR